MKCYVCGKETKSNFLPVGHFYEGTQFMASEDICFECARFMKNVLEDEGFVITCFPLD